MFLDRRDAAGDGAAGLLGGDAGLVERGGVDEVADGFGLREIDAAVEVGAQGEFAGFGEAGAGFQGALDGVAQDHGRAVAGDFDDVLGGIGTGSFEERGDHLVDGLAVAIEQFGKVGVPGAPLDGREDAVRNRAGVAGRRCGRCRCLRGRGESRWRRWCR